MSETNVKNEFSNFGKKALILAIFALCSIFSFVLIFIIPFVYHVIQIISAIVLILAAMTMGKAGKILNNQKLLLFRSKIIMAVILATIGGIFITTRVLIQGLILFCVGGVLYILGWIDLKGFFQANMGMFPEDLGIKATSGSRIMMIGAIFYLTFFLSIIGFILWVIGYFKLSNLKKLG